MALSKAKRASTRVFGIDEAIKISRKMWGNGRLQNGKSAEMQPSMIGCPKSASLRNSDSRPPAAFMSFLRQRWMVARSMPKSAATAPALLFGDAGAVPRF